MDLNANGWAESEAHGEGGGAQVGRAIPTPDHSGNYHAVLWRGSSDSAVDLNPPGYIDSNAYATDGTTQVGWGNDPNNGTHAVLWRGTASSYVDLGPGKLAFAVRGGKQVGVTEGVDDIIVWSGTAESAVGLRVLMPSNLAPVLPQLEFSQGPVAIDSNGTIFALAKETSGSFNYHAIKFVPTNEIKNALRVTNIRRLANGDIHLDCIGLPNLPFSVYATDKLTEQFQRVYSTTADSGGNFQFEDGSHGSQRFYRLRYP